MVETAGPDPRRIATAAQLARELDLLRSRAAHGVRRARLSLDELARRTGIPRSTVHSYVRGVRLPPPDSLDDLVIAMGASPTEQREWAEALFRVTADRFDTVAPVAPVALPVPRQLPAAPRVLVGRDAELARLTELLTLAQADPRAALVVGISGTGGVGKTALVLRWAHDAAEHFPDGQLWLDLRGYSPGAPLTPADALERLLRGLGTVTTELPADVETRAAEFRSAVAGKRLLLLLDNARDSAQVLPLLPGTSGCVTLVTSRTALRTLAAIGGAETVSVGRLPTSTALSLVAADLGGHRADDPAVAERIARHCGGLPLALRIVRERLSRASPAEVEQFAEELDRDERSRLAALELTDAGSEVSVRGALAWSYAALPPDAATLFRRLPLCYQSTFEQRTVAALLDVPADEARRLLQLLVDASLLDSAGPDRYRVHDLVLAYAEECLHRDEDAQTRTASRIRMAGYLIDLAECAIRSWDPRRPFRISRPAGLAEVRRQLPPELADRQIEAFQLAVQDLVRHGLIDLGSALGERAARTISSQGDLGGMLPALHVAIDAARTAGNDLAAAVLLRHVGISHGRRGELDEAAEAFTLAIECAQRAGSPVNEALDRANRALVSAFRGELAQARTVLAEQARVLQDLDVAPVHVWLNLAEIDLSRGDLESAAGWAERAVAELGPTLDDGGASGIEAWVASAQIACAMGDYPRTSDRLAELESSLTLSRHREYLARSYLVRATVQRQLGEFAAAERTASAALQIAMEMGERRSEIAALLLLGDIARLTQQSEVAVRHHERGLRRAEETGLRQPLAQSLASLALTLRDSGDPAAARTAARRAEQVALDCGFLPVLRQAREILDTVATHDE